MAKKEKKAKKEKADKKGRRAKREKEPKVRERRFAYDRAVSTLGGLVCAFAVLTVLAIILSVVYAVLFMR